MATIDDVKVGSVWKVNDRVGGKCVGATFTVTKLDGKFAWGELSCGCSSCPRSIVELHRTATLVKPECAVECTPAAPCLHPSCPGLRPECTGKDGFNCWNERQRQRRMRKAYERAVATYERAWPFEHPPLWGNGERVPETPLSGSRAPACAWVLRAGRGTGR